MCPSLYLLNMQVRVIDLERAAIKPFAAHRAKVRALTAISKGMWLAVPALWLSVLWY
jgi:hypothetical protein